MFCRRRAAILSDVSSRFHTHRSDGRPQQASPVGHWVKEIWAPLQRLARTLHCTSSKLLHGAQESDSVWTPRTKSDGRMPYVPATATNIKPSWGSVPAVLSHGAVGVRYSLLGRHGERGVIADPESDYFNALFRNFLPTVRPCGRKGLGFASCYRSVCDCNACSSQAKPRNWWTLT